MYSSYQDTAPNKSLCVSVYCPEGWHHILEGHCLQGGVSLCLQQVASVLCKTGSICMTQYVLYPLCAMFIGPLLHFPCCKMGSLVWHNMTWGTNQWIKIYNSSDSGTGWSLIDRKGKLIHRVGVYFCENQALALPGGMDPNIFNLPVSGSLVSLRECTMSGAQH